MYSRYRDTRVDDERYQRDLQARDENIKKTEKILSEYRTNACIDQITVFNNAGGVCTVHVCVNGAVVHYTYGDEEFAQKIAKLLTDNGVDSYAHEKY